MAVSVSKAASLLGQTLGHYRILEKIGEGGMGEVYRARDDHLGRDVAIKVLPAGILADEHARKRFRKEAEALSKLEHPNIATIHDFDTQGEVDFLVMEYIPGETLTNKLRQGPLPEKEVVRLGLQLAEGLAAAHEHGVIHRDLKPGNLRLTSDGRVKILDFGLAKLVHCFSPTTITESAPETVVFAGTLPYMAPEQLRGEEVDQRTDIYGVGVVFYEMATGQRPFGEKVSAVLMDDILHQYPPPLGRLRPQLSPRLDDIILKCLEKDRENRYQSAKELAVDLRRLQSGAETAAPLTRTPRWSARSVRLGLLLVASIITVLLALNIGNLRQRLFHPGEAPRIKSLAVLPLANLSDDPQQEYFADGMTEALIAELSQISSLKVISRTSVMRYKSSNKPLPQIARELNVDGIIEGSALHSGNRVRITAQLIQASSDTHVWGKSYERDLRDVLALQGEVAQAIAKEIKTNLTPQEHARLARARPVNPEAYEPYLRGRYEWNKRTKDSLYKALDYFRQAIKLDPTYALAYSGLADVYLVLCGTGFLPGAEVFPKSKAAALKALELDENSAEAHVSLAAVLSIVGRDRTAVLREYETAIQLSPNYATAHQWYAVDLAYIGRSGDAIREIEQARRLDPLSVRINTSVPYVYYLARQYDRAVAEAHKALELELEPRDPVTHRILGWIYLQKRMPKEALAEFKMELTLEPGSPRALANLALGYAVAGNIKEAEKILAGLQQRSKEEYVTPYFMARAYVGLGQKEQAMAWLQKGFEVQDALMERLKVDPALDPLRSDPRFQDLLRRMNFPE